MTPRPIAWVQRCVIFWLNIFIMGCILWLYQTQKLFKICAPDTDVTWFSWISELLSGSHKKIGKVNLISSCHTCRWVAVVFWLSCLILVVDLWVRLFSIWWSVTLIRHWIKLTSFTSTMLLPMAYKVGHTHTHTHQKREKVFSFQLYFLLLILVIPTQTFLKF